MNAGLTRLAIALFASVVTVCVLMADIHLSGDLARDWSKFGDLALIIAFIAWLGVGFDERQDRRRLRQPRRYDRGKGES